MSSTASIFYDTILMILPAAQIAIGESRSLNQCVSAKKINSALKSDCRLYLRTRSWGFFHIPFFSTSCMTGRATHSLNGKRNGASTKRLANLRDPANQMGGCQMEELFKWIGGAGSFKKGIVGMTTTLLGYAAGIGVVWVIAVIAYWFWNEPTALWYSIKDPTVLWYAAEYEVSPDKVHIVPKPTDCDFWHAPVGFKDCHYEKRVTQVGPNAPYDPVWVSWVKKSD
jgi:hypothetical protein